MLLATVVILAVVIFRRRRRARGAMNIPLHYDESALWMYAGDYNTAVDGKALRNVRPLSAAFAASEEIESSSSIGTGTSVATSSPALSPKAGRGGVGLLQKPSRFMPGRHSNSAQLEPLVPQRQQAGGSGDDHARSIDGIDGLDEETF